MIRGRFHVRRKIGLFDKRAPVIPFTQPGPGLRLLLSLFTNPGGKMASMFGRTISALVVLTFGFQPSAYAEAPAKPPLVAPKPDGKLGSDFLQCDGVPRAIPVGEALVDVALITGTLGLFGLVNPVETSNVDKRLEAEPGIAACDRALAQDTTPVRRAQLVLARAIHRIEAKQYDAAIADLHTVATVAGDKAAEPGFRESLGLTAMELESAALLREGKATEASRNAIAMAAASPYDINNLARAQRYLLLTADMTPEKAQYLERYVRLAPQSLVARSSARELAGDFTGAAEDMAALVEIDHGVWPDQPLTGPLLRRSVLLALIGDVEQSDALTTKIQTEVDDGVRVGKISEADGSSFLEQLDFRNVLVMADKGQISEARAAFRSRSRWLAPWPSEVAFITAKLRAGAPTSELTGALARDPAKITSDALATYGASAVVAGRPQRDANLITLYGAMRPYIDASAYHTMSGVVWRAEKSKLLLARTGKETYQGEVISLAGQYPASAVPLSEGAILHAAVIAKARGLTGFIVLPTRQRLDTITVRFGNSGEPGFPKSAFVDAGQTITDLSPKIPGPNP